MDHIVLRLAVVVESVMIDESGVQEKEGNKEEAWE
jgi:hypothetical protein